MNNKIKKFESKDRLDELSPLKTLKRIGFREGMVLCDIGAGTGVFSFPAAQISKSDIYALEKSEDMIEILKERILDKNIDNIKVKKVDSDILPLESHTCDITIMVTSLHHIEDKKFMISEIKRILKDQGRLAIIEFYKRKTPLGPSVDHRISQEEVEITVGDKGLKKIDSFSLGDNFYCFLYELL
nr:methyltransferase domain-containing protein [Tissierella sp.]